VVKIERPGGEDVRHFPPYWRGNRRPSPFSTAAKKSLVADLKQDATGRASSNSSIAPTYWWSNFVPA